MRYLIGRRSGEVWVRTRDGIVIAAHDTMRSFVGQPLSALLNWALGRGVPYYVQEEQGAKLHRLNGRDD